MFSQISLNFWKEEYEAIWITGSSNELATKILFSDFSQVLLCGPKFCGKKHLASILARSKKIHVNFLSELSDIEIIAKYDKHVTKNDQVIWISSFQERVLDSRSLDVKSRLKSLTIAQIDPLSEDMFYPLLEQRLRMYEFKNGALINYCMQRLPKSYEIVEELLRYVRQKNAFSLGVVQEFIARRNFESAM